MKVATVLKLKNFLTFPFHVFLIKLQKIPYPFKNHYISIVPILHDKMTYHDTLDINYNIYDKEHT